MKFSKVLSCTSAVGLLLASCANETDFEKFHSKANESVPLKSISSRQVDPVTVAAVDLMKKGEYSKASSIINLRLQEEPTNVAMHILNALTYEKMAEAGDGGRLDLAVVGYESALNVDPNNLLALSRLGALQSKKRNFDKAQEHFANALLIKPDDPGLLQELAAASYYAYDLRTAKASIDKAVDLVPEDVLANRSATMINAALGDFELADQYFGKYKSLVGQDEDIQVVEGRLQDWKGLYGSGRIHLAQAAEGGFPAFGQSSDPDGSPQVQSLTTEALSSPLIPTTGGAGVKATKGVKPSDKKQQIIIDCYLLRINEGAGTSKGQNILKNLDVTLTPGGFFAGRTNVTGNSTLSKPSATGGGAGNTASLSQSIVASTTALGSIAPSISAANAGHLNFTSFFGGLTWSGLTYNLNIANVTDNRTEVIARPSLLTFVNKESVFFSGSELVAGISGDNGGSLVKYPVGVTLVVTPTFIDEDTGMVYLTISVEGAEFDDPNVTQDLTKTVTVGKTRIDTTAKVKLGETLALGGIYERAEIFSKDGFPGLSDIPIVQYLFSNEQSTLNRRSVVILMTPRSPEKTKRDIQSTMQGGGPHMKELQGRHPEWFTTQPNFVKIFAYLALDPVIYQSFRSVDILPPSWGEPDRFVPDQWGLFKSFLYY